MKDIPDADYFFRHQEYLAGEDGEILKRDFIQAMTVTLALGILIKQAVDYLMAAALKANPDSSAKKYMALKRTEQWYYASFYTSMVYSVYLSAFTVKAILSCETPDPSSGTTILSSHYCLHNSSLTQFRTHAQIMGIICADGIIQAVLVRDFSSGGAIQNYVHHALVIIGSSTALYLGRFFCAIASSTIITEVTTPFVNIRYLLYFHGKQSGPAYFYNGLAMTFSFFSVRVLFMIYCVFVLLIPANRETDFSKEPSFPYIAGQASIYFYLCLLGLNCFWFKKMMAGTLKYLGKSKAGGDSKAADEKKKS